MRSSLKRFYTIELYQLLVHPAGKWIVLRFPTQKYWYIKSPVQDSSYYGVEYLLFHIPVVWYGYMFYLNIWNDNVR
jgi:hypothetical protein